ncbi:bifunctional phosphopantothenoylcysteine decarboxylase/phosphopantothenate--cysteine ligase CoaBC [Methanospirillum purgamenti]|jgi:phosphopantothenoylcysteine decarboxylase/phosphopantothenate--cysteine ligase|uniref:Coenzyme A biosynthesis bifunctional protein CoaBC n=1 Tax=Methanospirillum hungatei TaxID=2203 RepID=A0A8F5VLK2_METHU|nr:bifunctional phosphopantothenoylcysteine decarboxylase/phosphopantothenate--cysteine ligase CoaBC [Methanospirillum hungatei]QXO95059.1 bifunctional phosphopantothenoylcysteine decarboxylase/phosphopantothenate--cysteine ligase CoaBC [Methanospirillum hungatei]
MTLYGKTILLGVTGSIAAVETVRLIHALKRKGAQVKPVMSQAACSIIHPDALTYASGQDTITRITGHVEHVTYCGDDGLADLFLIAPCTANTISKIACGIDDTTVTTCATTALGRKMPIIIVPAMHHAMFRHDIVIKNLDLLTQSGITIVGPRIEEGKAKIADINEIILWCERLLSGGPLSGKHILITSGRCEEPVDDVRVLTTRSSGRMGQELAYEAFRLGADVTIIHRDEINIGTNIRITTATSMGEAIQKVMKEKRPDIYISAAAISDFAPECLQGKIPSGKSVNLTLHPLPKLIDLAIQNVPITVAFKLGTNAHEEGKRLLQNKVSMVLANTPDNLGSEEGRYTIMDSFETHEISGKKQDIAKKIFERIITRHL